MSKREHRMRDILSGLMDVDASQISLTQPFAEQGVDSLIGLRFTRELQDMLEVEVELEWLFDNPSIRELSGFLDQRFGELDAEPSHSDQDHRARA